MKKFAIVIIIGSLLSGIFLPGILGVPIGNSNIASAQSAEDPDNPADDGGEGNTNSSSGSPIQTPEPESLFSCKFQFTGANFLNCISLTFYVPYYITQILAAISGMFLDVMIDYSTQSASYESGFVSEGWKIIRDLTNIGFIFALLYIAISTIVGQGAAKSTLVWVIIMALVVNFSFFTTRVVIDASNILARVFYQNINIQDPNQEGTTKSITAVLIDKVKIQNIEADLSASLREQEDMMSEWKIALAGILVLFIIIIVNAVMIFVFFSIAMLFVGRVIGLWFSIIASPLAFLSIAFPGGKAWKRVGWTTWSSDLVGTAFLAPVFLFFIYLIILFLNTGFLTDAMSGGTSLSSVLVGIIVPFAFFMILLMTAKKISTELAGEIASTVTKALNTAMMVAGGAAMAGTALAGGAVGAGLGKLGTSAGSRLLARNATGTGWKAKAGRFAGSSLNSAGKGMKSVNWDPRNNMIGKGLNQVGSLTGAGTMPTFGQEFGKKYASGQGFTDLKEKRNEEWRKKKQARADELADAVAEHGVDPVTNKKYSTQVAEHKDNKEEFMAKFGGVMDKIDSNIKEKGNELKEARMLLKAAQDTKDPAKIAKAEKAQLDALDNYTKAKADKESFKKGSVVDVDGFGKVTGSVNGRSLDNIETSLKSAEQGQTKATAGARNFYAEEIRTTSKPEQVLDAILSGGGSIGQHKQASRDVRNKAKEEEKKAQKPETTT